MSSTLDNSKMQEGSTKTSSDGRRQFKLTRRIGLGGFGEVYLAEMSTPTGFTKTVALKLLRSDVEGAGDNARRMRDEARLLGLLRHRAIVKADDLITVDGRTAVVMEFVPGANLSDLLNEERFPHPLPANLGLEVGAELADAMDAAWSRPSSVTKKPLEVLHRDIKPGNVRITPDGEIKILDFGIARADQMDRETATRDYAVGSLPYMAPELLVGQGASPASDMYALGVTLLEILTRSRFGIAQDTAEAHVARVEERLASIELPELDPCREELESLIRGMLAFEASGRPEARAVAKQLNQISHSLHLLPIQDWARQKIDQVQSAAVLGPNESVTREDMSGRVFFEDIASKADTWDGDTLGLTKSDVDRARERREDKSWIWKTALIGLIGLLAVLGYRLLDGDGAGESDAVVQASSEGTGTDGTGSEGTGTGSEGTGTGGTGSEGTGTGGTGSGGPGSDGPGLAVTGGPGAGGQQDESASLGGTGQAPADSNGGSEEPSMDRPESGSSASDSTQSVQPSSDRGEPSQTPQSGSDSDTQPTEAPPEVPMGPVVVKVSSEPTMQIDIQLDGAALKTPHKQELVPGSYRLICNPQGAAFSATIVVPADGGSWTCNTTLRKVTGP